MHVVVCATNKTYDRIAYQLGSRVVAWPASSLAELRARLLARLTGVAIVHIDETFTEYVEICQLLRQFPGIAFVMVTDYSSAIEFVRTHSSSQCAPVLFLGESERDYLAPLGTFASSVDPWRTCLALRRRCEDNLCDADAETRFFLDAVLENLLFYRSVRKLSALCGCSSRTMERRLKCNGLHGPVTILRGCRLVVAWHHLRHSSASRTFASNKAGVNLSTLRADVRAFLGSNDLDDLRLLDGASLVSRLYGSIARERTVSSEK